MSRIDPTVKKETGYIAGWVLLLSAVMELVFLLTGHMDYTVSLGNLLGGRRGHPQFLPDGMDHSAGGGAGGKGRFRQAEAVADAADADADRHLLRRYRAELLPDGSGDRAPVLPAHRGGLPSAF